MILSEFECLEGYNTDLNWQTKSRLEMLSAAGGGENGLSNGDGLAHSSSKVGASGRRKAQRSNSLLDPEVEMSHSQVYQNDAPV